MKHGLSLNNRGMLDQRIHNEFSKMTQSESVQLSVMLWGPSDVCGWASPAWVGKCVLHICLCVEVVSKYDSTGGICKCYYKGVNCS